MRPFLAVAPVHHLSLHLHHNLLTEQTWALLWYMTPGWLFWVMALSDPCRLAELRSLDLNLSHNRMSGHLSIRPLETSWMATRLHTLQIDLSNNRGKDEGYAACLNSLGALGDHLPNLRKLHLAMYSCGRAPPQLMCTPGAGGKTMYQVYGLISQAPLPLIDLSLRLSDGSHLAHMREPSNHVDGTATTLLAQLIQGHLPSLRRLTLQLAHNEIDASGAHDLVQSIQCVRGLEQLTLSLLDNPCMTGDVPQPQSGPRRTTDSPMFALVTHLLMTGSTMDRLCLECPAGAGALFGLLSQVIPVACPVLRCLSLTNFVPSGHRSPPRQAKWLPRCEHLTVGLNDGILDMDDLILLEAVCASTREVHWNLEDVVSFPEVIARFVSSLEGLRWCQSLEIEWQKGYLTERRPLCFFFVAGTAVTDGDVQSMRQSFSCTPRTGDIHAVSSLRAIRSLSLRLDDPSGCLR